MAERNLNHQAFNAFLPRLKTSRRTQERWRSGYEPLFLCYLFVQLKPVVQNISPIRSTRDVLGLVRLGAVVEPFPEVYLATLIDTLPEEECLIDTSLLFEVGEIVKLDTWPMAGLRAVFKARSCKDLVIVLLNILGEQTEVTLSPHVLCRSV